MKIALTKKPPLFLKKYFWDISYPHFDPKSRSQYTIERLLEIGDEQAVKWVFRNFERVQIEKTVRGSRVLSEKTANFWSIILDIPRKEILCLQPDYLKQRKAIWPY